MGKTFNKIERIERGITGKGSKKAKSRFAEVMSAEAYDMLQYDREDALRDYTQRLSTQYARMDA